MPISVGSRFVTAHTASALMFIAGFVVALGWLPISVLEWMIPVWGGVLVAYITLRGLEKKESISSGALVQHGQLEVRKAEIVAGLEQVDAVGFQGDEEEEPDDDRPRGYGFGRLS